MLKYFKIIFLTTIAGFTSYVHAEEKLVQIAVEIVEVDTNLSHQFGINWIDAIRAEESSIPGVFAVGDFTRLTRTYADLKLLMEKGAADLLANPKLVTKNNTTASFNAGGEIPYIVAGENGQVSVQFKKYGVVLEIKPVIKSEDSIDVELKSEVSCPDESVFVSLSGNIVPGILSRSISSELNIKSGATITIAGLNQTRKERIKVGVPLLADIPVLGVLFGKNKIITKKTSIVIFVTPTILEET